MSVSHPACRSRRRFQLCTAENLKGGNEPPFDSNARGPCRRPIRAGPDRDELLRRPGRARRSRGGRRRPRRRRCTILGSSWLLRRTLRGDPRSRTGTGTISVASPTSPRRPARRCTWPRTSASARSRPASPRRGSSCGRTTPELLSRAARRSTLAGISFRRSSSRDIRRHTSPTTRTARSSPATSCLPARSAAPTSRRRLGSAARVDQAARRPLPAETIVYSGHGPATTLGAELAAQPVPRGAARAHDAVPGAARHARRPPVRAAALAVGDRRRCEDVAALYGYRRIETPAFEDTELFVRTSGGGSDVVQKEMYTFDGPRRPLAHAAARGDRADLPRLPRARSSARAAAGEALHDRADVSIRPRRSGAGTASTGSCRSRRSAPTIRRSTPR